MSVTEHVSFHWLVDRRHMQYMDLFMSFLTGHINEMWRFCTVVSPLSWPVLLFLVSVVMAAGNFLFVNQAASRTASMSFVILDRELADDVTSVVSSRVLHKFFGFVEISRAFAYVQ